MTTTPNHAEPGLTEFLSARARHASDTRLALDAAGGVLVAVAAAIWQPAGWLLLLPVALCFAAFGGWGIANRELGELTARPAPAPRMVRAFRALRGTAATVGLLAGVAALLQLLAFALGTWIS